MRAAADQIYEDCVDELAWALHTNATAQAKPFRAELAALFWASGDVLHAQLLRPDGPDDYLPPYALVRTLVSHSMRTLPDAPLIQHIWLDMKDRGPFSLREHRLLFGHINNVFRGFSNPLYASDEISRAYAEALIAWMRGHAQEVTLNELFDPVTRHLIRSMAPHTYLSIAALAAAIEGANSQKQWNALASLAASIIQWADHNGIYEPLDHTLDAPFMSCVLTPRQRLNTRWTALKPTDRRISATGFRSRRRCTTRVCRSSCWSKKTPCCASCAARASSGCCRTCPVTMGATASK